MIFSARECKLKHDAVKKVSLDNNGRPIKIIKGR